MKHSRKKRYTRDELLHRMLANTTKLEDGCWIWNGYTRNGYGSFSVNDHPTYLHHLSWILHFGPIPDGTFVLHHCDNKRCWCPKCLFVGTQHDNVKDMWNKKRARYGINACGLRGQANFNAVHEDTIVEAAKALRATGTSQRAVAQYFAVSQSTIWRWVHGVVRP